MTPTAGVDGPEIPDAVQPLIGFREWSLREADGRSPELFSLFHPTGWPVGAALSAVCLRPTTWPYRSAPAHRAVPEVACGCGIYAYLRPDFETFRGAHGPRARGIVAGWGRYVLGGNGWRTQFARLVALLEHAENPRALERVAARYGVPILSTLAGTDLAIAYRAA